MLDALPPHDHDAHMHVSHVVQLSSGGERLPKLTDSFARGFAAATLLSSIDSQLATEEGGIGRWRVDRGPIVSRAPDSRTRQTAVAA